MHKNAQKGKYYRLNLHPQFILTLMFVDINGFVQTNGQPEFIRKQYINIAASSVHVHAWVCDLGLGNLGKGLGKDYLLL